MSGLSPASRHLPIGVIAALVVTVVLVLAAPAGAIPAVGCGQLTVNHKTYSVRAHVLSCTLARRWSAAFLAHGTVPVNYECQRYSPKVTRVRFLCVDPATASRSDGPRSFNATA